MRRIWFDDRSKCCRFRRWLSPSILAMRLQCTLSVCRSELKETSSKLRRKGTRHQPGSFTPGPPCPTQPRHSRGVPRARLPAPAAVRHQLRLPLRHAAHLLTPLSMRLSSPRTARSPAMSLFPSPHKPLPHFSLQTSLASQRRHTLLYGRNTTPSRQPYRKAAPPRLFSRPPPRAWRTRRGGDAPPPPTPAHAQCSRGGRCRPVAGPPWRPVTCSRPRSRPWGRACPAARQRPVGRLGL